VITNSNYTTARFASTFPSRKTEFTSQDNYTYIPYFSPQNILTYT